MYFRFIRALSERQESPANLCFDVDSRGGAHIERVADRSFTISVSTKNCFDRPHCENWRTRDIWNARHAS
jgi:hypothetical protein